jgi:putative acetyltransferase
MKLVPFQLSYTTEIIELIDGVYREYGFNLCLPDAEKDLAHIHDAFADGMFQVLVNDANRVCGTVAVSPQTREPEHWYLKRLYLHSSCRGTEWAAKMMGWAESTVKAEGAVRIELWSDIQFTRAHAFYVKNGYLRNGLIRTMLDSWIPYKEFFFFKDL